MITVRKDLGKISNRKSFPEAEPKVNERKTVKNIKVFDNFIYIYFYAVDLILRFKVKDKYKEIDCEKITKHFLKLYIESRGATPVFLNKIRENRYSDENGITLINMKFNMEINHDYENEDKMYDWYVGMSQAVKYKPDIDDYILATPGSFSESYSRVENFVENEIESLMNTHRFTAKEKETLAFTFTDDEELTPYHLYANYQTLKEKDLDFKNVVVSDIIINLRLINSNNYSVERERAYPYTSPEYIKTILKLRNSFGGRNKLNKFLNQIDSFARDMNKIDDPFFVSSNEYKRMQSAYSKEIQTERIKEGEKYEVMKEYTKLIEGPDDLSRYLRRKIEALSDLGMSNNMDLVMKIIISDIINICSLPIFNDYSPLSPTRCYRFMRDFFLEHYVNYFTEDNIDNYLYTYLSISSESKNVRYTNLSKVYCAFNYLSKKQKD